MTDQYSDAEKPLVLVTGANGFVGQALCAELINRGFTVKAATRAQFNAIPSNRIEPVSIGEIDGSTTWENALRHVKIVFHLAARVHVMKDNSSDPLKEFMRVNVDGTENLARAAAASGVKRFVYVSSIGVNGAETDLNSAFGENDTPFPHNPYSVSKLKAEQKLLEISRETGLEIVILRPPLIYGKDAPGNFARMVSFINKDIPLPLGSVKNLRSLIYIENFIDALILSAEHPEAAGKTYLVSDGKDISTPDLLTLLGSALGHPPRLLPCPRAILSWAAQISNRRVQINSLTGSLRINSEKIRRDLGWIPPYTLEQGISETARQIRN